jgi:hypothetical protein
MTEKMDQDGMSVRMYEGFLAYDLKHKCMGEQTYCATFLLENKVHLK